MDEKKSYLAGAGIAILFGTSFLASKTALSVFVQPAILAWRFTVAACILWILAIFNGHSFLPGLFYLCYSLYK